MMIFIKNKLFILFSVLVLVSAFVFFTNKFEFSIDKNSDGKKEVHIVLHGAKSSFKE